MNTIKLTANQSSVIRASVLSNADMHDAIASIFQSHKTNVNGALFAIASCVADAYNEHPAMTVTCAALVGRQGITIGTVMDDGSIKSDKSSNTAVVFFKRAVKGYLAPQAKTAKSGASEIGSAAKRAIARYSKQELKAYIALLQAAI